MMSEFHVHVYGPDRGPIESSFEEAQERLEKIAKLYFEPDGSFVWNRAETGEQLFGMLYDAGGRIRYCELRGRCRVAAWRAVCDALTGGDTRDLQLVSLPDMQLQDLQRFEGNALMPEGSDSE